MLTDTLFGVHAQALTLREKRAQVLASNIASASVPGYQARDINFYNVLAQQTHQMSGNLNTSDPRHFSFMNQSLDGQTLEYRVPFQPAMDGNTVDLNLENKNFVENAMRYQTSLTFITQRVHGLMQSMQGEA